MNSQSVTSVGSGGHKVSKVKTEGSGKRWSKNEDETLKEVVELLGPKNWKKISLAIPGRTDVQCLHRWQKVLRPGLVKGPWTKEEDETVIKCMQQGMKKWSEIASFVPGRIGKQCRERWFNHLDPTIQKGDWTKEEDDKLFKAQHKYGNKWSFISTLIPGRTENAVKNRWNGIKRRRGKRNRKKSASQPEKKRSRTSISGIQKVEIGSKAAEVANFMANLTSMAFIKTENTTPKQTLKQVQTNISKAPQSDKDLAATILLFSQKSHSTLSPINEKQKKNTGKISRRLTPKKHLKI